MRRVTTATKYSAFINKRDIEEINLGTLLHNVLFHLPFYEEEDDLKQALLKTSSAFNISLGRLKSAEKCLKELFGCEEIKAIFKKGIKNLREIEVVDKEGRLHRLDRINFLHNKILVIDYKLEHFIPLHKEQIKTYMQILKEIYPQKSIRGILLYVKTKKMVEVGWEE